MAEELVKAYKPRGLSRELTKSIMAETEGTVTTARMGPKISSLMHCTFPTERQGNSDSKGAGGCKEPEPETATATA